MKESVKEKLRLLIEKDGLVSVRKLTGLSYFDLVNMTNIKITHDIANTLFLEYIGSGRIPYEYKDFTLKTDLMEGSVTWTKSKVTTYFGPPLHETIEVYATPFWDGKEILPIDVMYYGIDGKNVNMLEKGTEELDGWATIFLLDKNGRKKGLYFDTVINKEMFTFDNIEQLFNWYKSYYLPTVYEYITNECIPGIREKFKKEIEEIIYNPK